MKKVLLLIGFIVSAFLLAAQNPGDLNTDFGNNGLIIENWTDTISRAYDVGIQSDGHLIVAGHLQLSTEKDVYIASLDNEGLPCNFGNFSRGFTYSLSTDDEFITAVKILADDKILVAGHWVQMAPEAFVVRFLANGEPDESFAENGVFDLGENYMEVEEVDVYGTGEDYKIVIAGKSYSGYPMLVMINQDGTLVTPFGDEGIVTFGEVGEFTDIVIDNVNNVLYGTMSLGGGIAVIAKYNLENGTPVSAFGSSGFISSEALGVEMELNAISLDIDNQLLAAFGEYMHVEGDLDMCALRVNADDGSIDNTFGINGWSWLRSAGSDELLKSVILQSDGKYYIGGISNLNGNYDFLVGRLTNTGIGDNTFGVGGLMLLPVPTDQYIGNIALNPDETVLYAAGYSSTAEDAAITIAAFHTTEVTGIGKTENTVSLYPNPARNYTIIETGSAGTHSVCITDISGRVIARHMFNSERCTLDVSNLAPALYFINVSSTGNHTLTGKLVIK
ncbi:MAG TPA: T9SS type A sorting domain-containing protein [Bacteroidales bacterium]|nr:T9SS type A sorting domain-containing protein [Bacteroidales bacterium]